jgi:hypothetical protein
MGLFDRLKGAGKGVGKPSERRDPADRGKQAGAREYEARHHDRRAATLEQSGDAAGAAAERDLASDARNPPPKVPRAKR